MIDTQSLFCFHIYVLSAKTQNLKKVCTGLFTILNQLYATGSSHSDSYFANKEIPNSYASHEFVIIKSCFVSILSMFYFHRGAANHTSVAQPVSCTLIT